MALSLGMWFWADSQESEKSNEVISSDFIFMVKVSVFRVEEMVSCAILIAGSP